MHINTAGNSPLKIAILGAAGRVGRMLSQVFQTGNFPDISVSMFSRAWQGPYWTPDNARDLHLLNAHVGGFDCLINLAAPPVSSDVKTLKQNTALALATLGHAKDLKIPNTLLISSAAIYGAPNSNIKLAETTSPKPVTDYGQAKLAMEHAVADWRANNLGAIKTVSCLRIGNIAGADQLLCNTMQLTGDTALVLDQFASQTGPKRSYIGLHTLARTFASLGKATRNGAVLPRILNVSAPNDVLMSDLLNAANTKWTFRPAPPKAIETVSLDTSRLAKFHHFSAHESTAPEMVKQWHHCQTDQ